MRTLAAGSQDCLFLCPPRQVCDASTGFCTSAPLNAPGPMLFGTLTLEAVQAVLWHSGTAPQSCLMGGKWGNIPKQPQSLPLPLLPAEHTVLCGGNLSRQKPYPRDQANYWEPQAGAEHKTQGRRCVCVHVHSGLIMSSWAHR